MSRWVLVTRGQDEVVELAEALADHGLGVVAFPVLTVIGHEDPQAWERALALLDILGVIILTSPRAAAGLLRQARARRVWEQLVELPVAAVGAASAASADTVGLRVELVGAAGGADLAGQVIAQWPEITAALHVCGRDRRPELGQALGAAGLDVAEVPVYAVEITPASQLPSLPAVPPAAVVLSSPRAARAYRDVCGDRYDGVPHLAFGATTATAARELHIAAEALREPTVECIVEELCPIN